MKIPLIRPTSSLPTIASVFDYSNVLSTCLVSGAVLLRGFPDMRDVRSILPGHEFACESGVAPRTRITEGILTATDASRGATIPFHHELTHAPERPSHVIFHAVCPSVSGGETVLTDSRRLAQYVRVRWPHVASELDDGVVYRHTFPHVTEVGSPKGRSWRELLGVNTRTEAERIMAVDRMSWRWSDAGLWTQSPSIPAFRHHPKSGECAFHNSLIAVYTDWNGTGNTESSSILFAKNERPIPVDFVQDVQRHAWKRRYECSWEPNDVLLVDNAITMHAHNSFTGNRSLHVRMLTS